MTIVALLIGAVSMGCAAIALFFLRFWRQSSDRLFIFFAVAFGILSCDYMMMVLLPGAPEWQMPVFLLRLTAFLVILLGIVNKNWTRHR